MHNEIEHSYINTVVLTRAPFLCGSPGQKPNTIPSLNFCFETGSFLGSNNKFKIGRNSLFVNTVATGLSGSPVSWHTAMYVLCNILSQCLTVEVPGQAAKGIVMDTQTGSGYCYALDGRKAALQDNSVVVRIPLNRKRRRQGGEF